jgi:small-conductance mechanosensitive channel
MEQVPDPVAPTDSPAWRVLRAGAEQPKSRASLAFLRQQLAGGRMIGLLLIVIGFLLLPRSINPRGEEADRRVGLIMERLDLLNRRITEQAQRLDGQSSAEQDQTRLLTQEHNEISQQAATLGGLDEKIKKLEADYSLLDQTRKSLSELDGRLADQRNIIEAQTNVIGAQSSKLTEHALKFEEQDRLLADQARSLEEYRRLLGVVAKEHFEDEIKQRAAETPKVP